MAGQKVQLKDQLGRAIRLNADATNGAQLGVNLFGPDGRLLRASDILNPTSPPSNASGTVWKLIREVPANLRQVAKLGGNGLAVRRDSGEWALRSIEGGEGIDVAGGDGEAGNPSVSLQDLPDGGAGAALVKITRDGKGRVSDTASATTSDLPEGSQLYFTNARADARIAVQKGQPSGITPLGPDALIPSQYLPPLAITEVFVVNSEAAQLALDAQEGDVAIRTDLDRNYIHNGGTAGTMADWTQLLTPAAPVQSVNGKTGNVVLSAADVGAATAAQGDLADSAVQPGDLAAVATSGAYSDLSGRPTLGTAAAADADDFATAAQGLLADSAVQEIIPGTGVTVDSTDPQRPIVSTTGGPPALLRLPFYLTDGSYAPIALTSAYALPFFLSNGTRADIPTVTA